MFNRGQQHITDLELAADLTALAATADRDRHTEPDQRIVAQFFLIHTTEANLGADSFPYDRIHGS